MRVRAQQIATEDDKSIEGYGFYPQRAMVEEEFNQIWEKQAAFHPEV